MVVADKAPHVVTEDMVKDMQAGSVIIDISVDQGGCIETCVPTTHENPTFIVDEILHYCVANMPGAVPYTSTIALTNVTLPFVLQIANKGWEAACNDNPYLAKGLNILDGKIMYHEIAESFDIVLN